MPVQTRKIKLVPPKELNNAHKEPQTLDGQARRDMARAFDETFANEWDDRFWEKMKRKGLDEFDFISIGGKSANSLTPPGIQKLPRDVQRDFLKSMLIHNLVGHGDTVEIGTISNSGAYRFHPVEIDFSNTAERAAPAEAAHSGGLLTRLGLGGKNQSDSGAPAARFKNTIPDEAEQKEIEKALKAGALTAEQSERAKVLRAQRCLAKADELADDEKDKDIAWCDAHGYADKRKSLCARAAEHRKEHEKTPVAADILDPKIVYDNDISEATRSAKQQPRVMTPKW